MHDKIWYCFFQYIKKNLAELKLFNNAAVHKFGSNTLIPPANEVAGR